MARWVGCYDPRVSMHHQDTTAEASRRFAGIAALYPDRFDRLRAAHVLVAGLGGVGSWTVEALARSGVGALTLLDGDEVCVSNINRQLHALDSTVGRPKGEVLAERVRDIAPDCRVATVPRFIDRLNAAEILSATSYDYVVDAIDGVMGKAWLIGTAHRLGVPVIASGGAGARVDPGRVRIVDLADTHGDRLLFFIRRKLRRHFGLPRTGPMGLPCVYSDEPARMPAAAECAVPEEPGGDLFGAAPTRLNCNGGLGAATFVTGVFGFLAASHVVNDLIGRASPAVRA